MNCSPGTLVFYEYSSGRFVLCLDAKGYGPRPEIRLRMFVNTSHYLQDKVRLTPALTGQPGQSELWYVFGPPKNICRNS